MPPPSDSRLKRKTASPSALRPKPVLVAEASEPLSQSITRRPPGATRVPLGKIHWRGWLTSSVRLMSPRSRVFVEALNSSTQSGVRPTAFVNDWFNSLTLGTLAGDFDGDGSVAPADVARNRVGPRIAQHHELHLGLRVGIVFGAQRSGDRAGPKERGGAAVIS